MSGSRRIEPRYANDRVISISILAAVSMAAVASVASSRPAASQQTPAAGLAPAGGEIAPRGQREVKDIAYGDWKKLCFKPGAAKMICRTSIAGTFSTGQLAVRVDIVEREGDATARLQVFCPVGMYLPKPATLTVDQGKAHGVPYTWCLSNACIAGTAVDDRRNGFRADAAARIRGF
jgi:invasion protein IalB